MLTLDPIIYSKNGNNNHENNSNSNNKSNKSNTNHGNGIFEHTYDYLLCTFCQGRELISSKKFILTNKRQLK